MGFYIARIDIKGLCIAVAARRLFRCDKTGKAHISVIIAQFAQMRENLSTIYAVNRIAQASIACTLKDRFPILLQLKGNIRPCHQHSGNIVADICSFRPCAFDKLQPGRHIKEQVLHLDRRSLRRSRGPLFVHVPATDAKECPRFLVRSSRSERYMRNGGDRCKRFPAEAQRFDMGQIIRRTDFARCMAQKSNFCILCGNSAAVIHNADILQSSAFCFDRNGTRSGINGVFDKLLNDRSRALNHLSRSDLVCRILTQYLDSFHSYLNLARICRS